MLIVVCVFVLSPAVVLVSALGSLVLLLALAMYRHQHPVNLYLLFAFVSHFYVSTQSVDGFVSMAPTCKYNIHIKSLNYSSSWKFCCLIIYLSETVFCLQTLLEAVSVATACK